MQGIHAPQKAAAKGRYQDGRCEKALRASGQGKLVCVSVWSLQHFQERSVVCSPEQSERAGENTVPLSRDAARLVRVSVDTWNFRPKDLLRLVYCSDGMSGIYILRLVYALRILLEH